MTDTNTDIIDRLRRTAAEIRAYDIAGWGNMVDEAADAIASLCAEVAALRAFVQDGPSQLSYEVSKNAELTQERDALRERAKLDYQYACRLATWLQRQYGWADFEWLGDLSGVLSQLDHMLACGHHSPKSTPTTHH